MNPRLIPVLLTRLAAFIPSSAVANPYRSLHCRTNLGHYLQELCSLPFSGHLLVGEAPGYQGCAITGIPFTSERVLLSNAHSFLNRLRPGIVVHGNTAEPTATMVWGHLASCTSVPAFWNTFPFHPHQPGNPKSNRAPTALEIESGQPFLQTILDILCPHTVIAVGVTASEALPSLFPSSNVVAVRHPSNGGKPKFIKGITAAGIV